MYIVRTKEIEPMIEMEQQIYFDEIPHSKRINDKIGSRFPFECLEKSKLEVYEIGTLEECKNFIKDIDENIRDFFTYELYEEC
ncbi:hypothetical protein L5F32_10490 [Aliarcobacter butzleri]|uniref:hypothetical protein n=1 Tax=Aliarcobacter butzleri TaxID=28197 RepID=UPI001EDB6681|nr:hypothetical protein [Aliarcobacter butzleri]MCG3652695.1 hypothetical protein [Aliarcobacter butzleri]